ncbi:MAG: autotransporter outer membrane beta-barrel domain-containing protein [Burkholderiaceae bacterium]|nr:autotransporter outer membrane beta-barrel domain-containing protein [Burkholderiaceae bacterium]
MSRRYFTDNPSPLPARKSEIAIAAGLLLAGGLALSASPAVAADREALQSNVTNDNGVVSVNIDFAPAAHTVIVPANQTVRSSNENPYIFSGPVEGLSASLLGQAEAQKASGVAPFSASVQSQVNAFGLPAVRVIDGGGGIRALSTGAQLDFNNLKWLQFGSSGTPTAPISVGDLQNLHFRNTVIHYEFTAAGAGGVVNGLVGNVSNNQASVSMGWLVGNAFSDIDIRLVGHENKHYLAGGGVVGVRATGDGGVTEASASIANIVGNVFKNVWVTTTSLTPNSDTNAYIEGGGIIGVNAVSSPGAKPGHATVDSLANNLFTNVHVRSDDVLLGGGLVGLNNNSQLEDATTTYVRLLGAGGNVFGNGNLDGDNSDITVRTGYSLRGGGVIGLNGLSNARVMLGALTRNVFAGIDVNAGTYIRGGGIVGLQSNDGEDVKYNPGTMEPVAALLEQASGNLFLNLKVAAGTRTDTAGGGVIEGGGIIGVHSNVGIAALDHLSGNIFKGLTVTTAARATGSTVTSDGHLEGGAIVGVSAKHQSTLQNASSNYFDDLSVRVGGAVRGGGVMGASSTDNATDSTDVLSLSGQVADNVFNNATVRVTGNLSGGGIVGSYAQRVGNGDTVALVNSLRNNVFTRVNTTVDGDITGGGVVGAHAAGPSGQTTTAGATDISGNRFEGAVVSARYLSGGGVLGFSAVNGSIVNGGTVYVETIAGNDFIAPQVTTSGYIQGGGVVGVRTDSGVAYIDTLRQNRFQGAQITAGTYIDGGGLVGATSNVAPLGGSSIVGIGLIDRSVFTGNTITANSGQIMGGAVYSYGLAVPMTISDSQFVNNTFTSKMLDTAQYGGGAPDARVYGTVTVDTGLDILAGVAPNTLTLSATSGNSTVFQNNQIVDALNPLNPRTNSLYFGKVLNVATDISSGLISTSPDPAKSDAELVVTPQAGGVVALYDPIKVDQVNNDGSFPDRAFGMTVSGAGDFLWGGANEFSVGTYDMSTHNIENKVTFESGSKTTLLSAMTLNASQHTVTLKQGGTVNVMGSNQWTVDQTTLEGHMHFNLPGTTLNEPDTALLKIHSTQTANIADTATVSLSNFAAGPTLKVGDRFYLIDTDAVGALDGFPDTKMAYAQQGLTKGYNFIIDKEHADSNLKNKSLVAHLASQAAPPPEARILNEGRAASLGFLARTASWLADHSYQQADLALKGVANGWAGAAFGGIDGSWLRVDTGSDVDILGTHMLVGLAAKNSGTDGYWLTSGFLEAGFARYDVDGHFGPNHRRLEADGNIRFFGIGAMTRLRWNSGFRLEGSLRAGRMENRFRSNDYRDVDGTAARYDLYTPYYAAHVGTGYEWKLNEKDTLDVLARYYWARQDGKNTKISTGERVNFEDDNSHRLRLGSRFTHARSNNFSWYVGAAYEYEFDGKVRGGAYGWSFDSPNMQGGTGIGEIGIIARPTNNDRFSAEVGLQGYVGRFRGVSGGVRLGWEF